MAEQSSIEWTDATWNPVRGCTKISAGCKHVIAETFAERWRGIPRHPYEQGFDLRLVPEKLLDPLKWRRSRRIFVNSMSDLFHENIDPKFVSAVLHTMRLADWHIYQVLTKRSARMLEQINTHHTNLRSLDHIWLGVSVENRKHGVPRIQHLRDTPAAIRFLSIEPLIEDLGLLDLRAIDWVIVGGESGPKARPMEPSWVLSIQQQCLEARIPFFFKQWGGVRKKLAGRSLEGRTWDEFPQVAIAAPPPRKESQKRQLQAQKAQRLFV